MRSWVLLQLLRTAIVIETLTIPDLFKSECLCWNTWIDDVSQEKYAEGLCLMCHVASPR